MSDHTEPTPIDISNENISDKIIPDDSIPTEEPLKQKPKSTKAINIINIILFALLAVFLFVIINVSILKKTTSTNGLYMFYNAADYANIDVAELNDGKPMRLYEFVSEKIIESGVPEGIDKNCIRNCFDDYTFKSVLSGIISNFTTFIFEGKEFSIQPNILAKNLMTIRSIKKVIPSGQERNFERELSLSIKHSAIGTIGTAYIPNEVKNAAASFRDFYSAAIIIAIIIAIALLLMNIIIKKKLSRGYFIIFIVLGVLLIIEANIISPVLSSVSTLVKLPAGLIDPVVSTIKSIFLQQSIMVIGLAIIAGITVYAINLTIKYKK